MLNLTALMTHLKTEDHTRAACLKLKLYKVIASDRRLPKAPIALQKSVPNYFPSPF